MTTPGQINCDKLYNKESDVATPISDLIDPCISDVKTVQKNSLTNTECKELKIGKLGNSNLYKINEIPEKDDSNEEIIEVASTTSASSDDECIKKCQKKGRYCWCLILGTLTLMCL